MLLRGLFRHLGALDDGFDVFDPLSPVGHLLPERDGVREGAAPDVLVVVVAVVVEATVAGCLRGQGRLARKVEVALRRTFRIVS